MNNLNEKWSEEMPVLYEMAIYIQEEFLEQYFEANGVPDSGTLIIDFKDAQASRLSI